MSIRLQVSLVNGLCLGLTTREITVVRGEEGKEELQHYLGTVICLHVLCFEVSLYFL